MSKLRRKIRNQNLVVLAMGLAVYLGYLVCGSFKAIPVAIRSRQLQGESKFAGSASCASCHNQIYRSHIATAHYLDSRPATKEFIKGSFAKGKNKFTYNRFTEVMLQEENNKFFQVSLINGTEMQREKFDIVIGSGRKGQTYLYWNNNELYQLPVSYYAPMDSWCNSPGYPSNYVRFNRPIPAECLECHGTYAKTDASGGAVNSYDRSSIIYGIDCERCHGPAAAHVNYHQQNTGEKKGKYIINTRTMDRQLRVDACALCHSGFRDAIRDPFSFQPGDKLDEFSRVRYNPDSAAVLDVHGNQYGLLTSSKCYKVSTQMDCSSCHDPHVNEFNDRQLFSARCMNCHQEGSQAFCKLKPVRGLVLSQNCVDCHMPVLESRSIQLNVANTGSLVPDPVRTHRIAVYPEITRTFLEHLKK